MTENISDALEEYYSNFVADGRIGDSTPKTLALPVANLSACLLDTKRTVPTAQYKIFRLVKDIGLRRLEIGTNHPSGAKFEGDYRSFRVEYGGDEKIISLSTSDYGGDRTIICVAVDKENYAHHALQLNVDNNVEVIGNVAKFFHSGKIAVGKFGSGKISELRELVAAKYPQVIIGKKFFLGTLTNDRFWTLDDEQIVRFVENLISYALIRDDFREVIINRRAHA